MKLKFKVQPYQTNAVESVVDCFANRPMISGRDNPVQSLRVMRRFEAMAGRARVDERFFEPLPQDELSVWQG